MRPATLSQRFRSLQQFLKSLVAEGDIERSPMATMRPPHVPETPPPVLREADLRKLLNACAGIDFEDHRDNAMIRVLALQGHGAIGQLNAPWAATRGEPRMGSQHAQRERARQ